MQTAGAVSAESERCLSGVRCPPCRRFGAFAALAQATRCDLSQHQRDLQKPICFQQLSMAVWRAVVALCLCGIVAATRRDHGVALNGNMEGTEDLGIDDYEMAPDFDKPLTDETELKSQRKVLRSLLYRLKHKEAKLDDAKSTVKVLRGHYLLDSQSDFGDPEFNGYQNCPELCMWCEPTKEDLEAGKGFRSVMITRARQWKEKFNPLKSEKQCGRVGFEFYQGGTHSSTSPFSTSMLSSAYGLKELRDWTGENKDEVADVTALSHCEWLRRNQTDLRHAVECVKHSMLCKGQGLPIPNPDALYQPGGEFCRKISRRGPAKVHAISSDLRPAEFFKKALQEEEERAGSGE